MNELKTERTGDCGCKIWAVMHPKSDIEPPEYTVESNLAYCNLHANAPAIKEQRNALLAALKQAYMACIVYKINPYINNEREEQLQPFMEAAIELAEPKEQVKP